MAVQLSSLAYQISLADPREILDIGTGIFALVLFSVSLYAWHLRKQTSLAIVALAFLMFFSRTVINEFFSSIAGEDVIDDTLVFIALALFFLAIVVRPRKEIGKGTD
jgi:hypothetical protein